MLIRYHLHPKKAVEAAAMFLKLHGNSMHYLLLLKLLYIADRTALEDIEQPITGDRYFSMDFGPVLSNIYDLIKGKYVENVSPIWSKFITKGDGKYHVMLIDDPGNDELCEEEEEIIRSVDKTYGGYYRFNLANMTHDYPEWKNPYGSSIPIAVEDILRSVGKSEEEIVKIQEEASRENYLDNMLHA